MGLEWVLEAPNTLNKNNIGKEAVRNGAGTIEHTSVDYGRHTTTAQTILIMTSVSPFKSNCTGYDAAWRSNPSVLGSLCRCRHTWSSISGLCGSLSSSIDRCSSDLSCAIVGLLYISGILTTVEVPSAWVLMRRATMTPHSMSRKDANCLG